MLELHDGRPREIDYTIPDTRTPTAQTLEMCAARYPRILPVWGEPESRALAVKLGTAWQKPHAVESGGNINVLHIDATLGEAMPDPPA